MIIDETLEFSDEQAITGDAASTNVIDLGVARDIGNGKPVPLNILITETFDNLTSLDISIQEDSDSAFGSAVTILTHNMLAAALVAGAKLPLIYLPQNTKRYLRLYYNVNGTNPAAGKISAAIVAARQTQ